MSKFSSKAYTQKLQKKAECAVSKAMTEIVTPAAKRAMYTTIKENVYNSYSPLVYERRGVNNGLLDERNIVTLVEGNRICVKNIAEPNESYKGTPIYSEPAGLLYSWIDQGRIPSYPHKRKRMDLTQKMRNKLFNESDFKIKLNDAVCKEMKK